MPNLKHIRADLETTGTIQLITQALGDIATARIQQTRASVTQNITFFQEISKVYRNVKQVALKNPIVRANYIRKIQKTKNGRTVVILVTSNSHFFGNLDYELSKFFMEKTKSVDCDRIVIGSTGAKTLIVNSYPGKFENIIFKKDFPTFQELRALSQKVFKYSKVFVFHTKFVTLLNQIPSVTDVNSSDLEKADSDKLITFITEPQASKILDFFESQILVLLFQAIFLEVDIAHQAARMISMNQAEINATTILNKQTKELLKMRKQLDNMHLLENYSAIISNEAN